MPSGYGVLPACFTWQLAQYVGEWHSKHAEAPTDWTAAGCCVSHGVAVWYFHLSDVPWWHSLQKVVALPWHFAHTLGLALPSLPWPFWKSAGWGMGRP